MLPGIHLFCDFDRNVSRLFRAAGKRLPLDGRMPARSNSSQCCLARRSFAAHLLEDGYGIRTVQELLGHQDVKTGMIYTHVLNRGGRGMRSPLEDLGRATGD